VEGPSSYFKTVSWEQVAKDGYQGVEITPYQWELRLDSRVNWYYSWDCASGCAWDPQAIESLQLVESQEAA